MHVVPDALSRLGRNELIMAVLDELDTDLRDTLDLNNTDNAKQWQSEQVEDPAYTDFIKDEEFRNRFNTRKGYSQRKRPYDIQSGLLVRKNSATNTIQVFVPKSKIQAVLKHYHNLSVHGHYGAAKTYDRIIRWFWWPTVYSDVQEYVACC